MHPLRNLTAVRVDEPVERAEVLQQMRVEAAFHDVHEYAEWLVGVRLLPESAPIPKRLLAAGLFVAQGEDRLSGPNCERLQDAVTSGAHARLAAVPGDLSFLSVRAGGDLFAIRSVSGLVPWYVVERPGRVVVASLLGEVQRWAGVDLDLDPLVYAMWADGMQCFPDDRTPLATVRAVRRGNVLRLPGRGSSSQSPWWSAPPSPDRLPAAAEAAERVAALRVALLDEVERDLDPRGLNLLAVSGGVDSSCLTALAAGRYGARVHAVTVQTYRDARDREYEAAYVRQLLDLVAVERHDVLDAAGERWLESLREAPVTVVPVSHPILGSLQGLLGADTTVYMGGEMADEVVGSAHTVPEWARAHSPWWIVRHQAAAPGGRRWVLQEWQRATTARLRRRHPLPRSAYQRELSTIFQPEVRTGYREWLDRTERLPRHSHPRSTTLDCIALDGFVAQNWEVASLLGVRRSMPFMSRAVMEIGLSCHPTELVGPGTKIILRRAMDGLVPAYNLARETKGTGRPGHDEVEATAFWSFGDTAPLGRVLRGDLPGTSRGLPLREASVAAILEPAMQVWQSGQGETGGTAGDTSPLLP